MKVLGLLWQGLNRLRRGLYRAGVLRGKRLPRPVISIGNIAAGGTGKTPAVIAVARFLAGRGLRVAVLTRGYGRSGTVSGLVTSNDAIQYGDEPVLIKRSTNASVLVGSNRYLNARDFDCDVFILDDGFQHLQLQRDFDLVIDAPTRLHREGRSALSDADAVIPRRLRTIVPDELHGKRLFAFAGLADNEQFFASLRQAGLDLAGTRGFPDHHRYTAADLASMKKQGFPLVTTEKDAVKIDDPEIVAVGAEMEIEEAILRQLLQVARGQSEKQLRVASGELRGVSRAEGELAEDWRVAVGESPAPDHLSDEALGTHNSQPATPPATGNRQPATGSELPEKTLRVSSSELPGISGAEGESAEDLRVASGELPLPDRLSDEALGTRNSQPATPQGQRTAQPATPPATGNRQPATATARKHKRRKNRFLQRLEYIAYRFVAKRVSAMSEESIHRWGTRLGALMGKVLRRRDDLAMRNLRMIYPERRPDELRRILDACWRHFGREGLISVQTQNLSLEEVAARCPVVNGEILAAAIARGKGTLLLGAHWGAWEVGGLALMAHVRNVRTVARPLDNELLERELQAIRAKTGAEIVDRRKAARALMRGLSENAIVVLLPDQAVQPREGVLVPFLGRPAWTTPAPAKMAIRAGSTIVFGSCIPDGLRHRIEFHESLLTEAGMDPVELTARINDVISRRIHERPELWLWMHDRWKGTGEKET